jgi:histidyl-tRNA synthetase
MARGRYREFYQCDFDVAGRGADMTQEAKVLKIVSEAFIELGIPFVIKFSHRLLMDLLMQKPQDSLLFNPQDAWETVRNEILEKRVSQWLITSANLSGEPRRVIQQLREFMDESAEGMKLLDSIEQLATWAHGVLSVPGVRRESSPGLDYYTGLVYEAVLTDKTYGVGSIAGGGRYDELIMRLNSSKIPTPAVGVSLGVERIFTIVENKPDKPFTKALLS